MHSERFWPWLCFILSGCSLSVIETTTPTISYSSRQGILFNEILFDPFPGESPWIELYNPSGQKTDLSTVLITYRSGSVKTGTPVPLSTTQKILNPEEYIVLCPDPLPIQNRYPQHDPRAFLTLKKLPPVYHSKGSLILLNSSGEIIEELCYETSMHHPLLPRTEGISLERINPELPALSASSWTSASATSGYGTPGKTNSSFSPSAGPRKTLFYTLPSDMTPGKIILQYQTETNGFKGFIDIWNIEGHCIARLLNGETLATQGEFIWDGYSSTGKPAPVGPYILRITVFHPDGRMDGWKIPCFLIRGL